MQGIVNGALTIGLALVAVTVIACVLGLMNTPR
jgi:hypothetical protein